MAGNTTSKESLHEGHRAGLRCRFQAQGPDGFEDDQILRLLLLYAIPRSDTNDLTHELLKRHGSLAGVLADPANLARTQGIGETAGTLLSHVPPLTRRYSIDRTCQLRHQFQSTERATELLVFMVGRSEEEAVAHGVEYPCDAGISGGDDGRGAER